MQIYSLKLPNEIVNEIEEWKLTCDKIKNSPLKDLKEHDNVGTKTNSYQTSIPPHLIESSYWLPFTLRNCAKLFGGNHRNYFLKKWDGHFDGYDVWINYSYKGDYNPTHSHSGAISGIMYLQNDKDETIFVNNNYTYSGNKGDMLLFPSNTQHKVDVQQKDYERITLAFNINYKEI